VVVVGAGVSGLTTALVLKRAGIPVRVYARDPSLATTSCNAGAIWGPHLVDHQRVKDWSNVSLAELTALAGAEQTGVRMVTGVEAARMHTKPPVWMKNLDSFDEVPAEELPAGFVVGWRYTVPIVDMPTYLRFLLISLAALDVHVEELTVGSAAEMAGLGRIVVNCTGLGSQTLMSDTAMEPVRGDLIKVDNPGIDEFFAEHTDEPVDQTYILPQGDFLLLGGTAVAGETSLAPDAEVARGIVERCAEVDDRLADAPVLEHRVGLRPNRTEIRLEPERVGASTIIHNYGHGGGGVTLSWGCAEEVRELVEKVRAN
jgi:D-amino-acid oxidase